eukprot:315352-Pleurochrysis_carterae.AAC.2
MVHISEPQNDQNKRAITNYSSSNVSAVRTCASAQRKHMQRRVGTLMCMYPPPAHPIGKCARASVTPGRAHE